MESPNISQTGVATVMALIAVTVLFYVYYETVGYTVQMGWDSLMSSRARGERVDIETPGGVHARLKPVRGPNELQRIESDVESALGLGSGAQVFNVSRNLYTFGEAEPLCRSFGAELANYDQVKDAYKAGGDWCNYGWTKGQLALYPTQKSTYDKLQEGPERERMACGLPGVNGGFFPNGEQRFGVNCYGPRPAETALDQRMRRAENSDIAFDREVNRFKAERGGIAVNPFNHSNWSA
jgi:hypothetical protein